MCMCVHVWCRVYVCMYYYWNLESYWLQIHELNSTTESNTAWYVVLQLPYWHTHAQDECWLPCYRFESFQDESTLWCRLEILVTLYDSVLQWFHASVCSLLFESCMKWSLQEALKYDAVICGQDCLDTTSLLVSFWCSLTSVCFIFEHALCLLPVSSLVSFFATKINWCGATPQRVAKGKETGRH